MDLTWVKHFSLWAVSICYEHFFLVTNPIWSWEKQLQKKPIRVLGTKMVFPQMLELKSIVQTFWNWKGRRHCTLSRGELLLSYERKEHLERTWHACVSSWLVHWTDYHWCDFLLIRIGSTILAFEYGERACLDSFTFLCHPAQWVTHFFTVIYK